MGATRRRARVLRATMAISLLALSPAIDPPVAHGAARCPSSTRAVRKPMLPRGHGEVSGVVASMRYPGWSWMIRDSGNPASLYAVRLQDGAATPLVREIKVTGTWNTDWEDIVYRWGSPSGHLFVLESGQSGRDTFVHEIAEPDPMGPSSVKPVARYSYAYPNGQRFNTEAAFWYAGRLVLVTKTAPGRVYRFDQGLTTGTVNVPTYVGTLAGADFVSVVRVSWDWRTIVAADHERTLVYRAPGLTRDLATLIGRPVLRCERVSTGDNVEGGDFVPPVQSGVTLVAESGRVYELPPVDAP